MHMIRPLYISTGEASKILGISKGAIQSLVDLGKLRGWKTQGGHRRILNSSIQEYLRNHNVLDSSIEHINIAVLDESNIFQDKLNKLDQKINVTVTYCTSAFELVTHIIKNAPVLCIVSGANSNPSEIKLIHEVINNSIKKNTMYIFFEVDAPFENDMVIYAPKSSESWIMGFLCGFMKTREIKSQ